MRCDARAAVWAGWRCTLWRQWHSVWARYCFSPDVDSRCLPGGIPAHGRRAKLAQVEQDLGAQIVEQERSIEHAQQALGATATSLNSKSALHPLCRTPPARAQSFAPQPFSFGSDTVPFSRAQSRVSGLSQFREMNCGFGAISRQIHPSLRLMAAALTWPSSLNCAGCMSSSAS